MIPSLLNVIIITLKILRAFVFIPVFLGVYLFWTEIDGPSTMWGRFMYFITDCLLTEDYWINDWSNDYE